MSRIAVRLLSSVFLCVLCWAMSGNAQVSPATVAMLAKGLDKDAKGLGVPCSNREAWQPLSPRFSVQIKNAEQYLDKPIPAWSDALYTEFSKTGQRVNGEKMLLDRQSALNSLVVAECAEGNGRFSGKISELVDSIATQRSWVYPAADPKLDDYSGRSVVIELNASAVADILAQTLYLLSSTVPQEVQRHVRDALATRILNPMRVAYTKGGGPSWLTVQSNWNIVCLSGVTAAALSVLPNPDDRALFVAGAQKNYSNYVNGFPSDGYSTEGVGYWNYGAGNYLELAARLFEATHGRVNILDNDAAKKIALYGAEIQMLPGIAANFGDAPFMSHPNPQLLNYLGYALSLPDAAGGPAADPRTLPAVGILSLDALTSFPIKLSKQSAPSESGNPIGVRSYFPVSKVLVDRPNAGGRFGMTFKAGGASGHGHNDLGSFSIGYYGQQPVGDPGGPAYYTAQSFSSQRYDSPLINSYGHPVPMIGGKLQKDATSLDIPVIETSFTSATDSITVDLTSAYDAPTLKRYLRTVTYSREGAGGVTIVDKFNLSSPTDVDEAFPTHGTWLQVDKNTIRITMKSSAVLATIQARSAPTFKAETINQFGNPFTRVGVTVHLPESGEIEIRIAPDK